MKYCRGADIKGYDIGRGQIGRDVILGKYYRGGGTHEGEYWGSIILGQYCRGHT